MRRAEPPKKRCKRRSLAERKRLKVDEPSELVWDEFHYPRLRKEYAKADRDSNS